MFVCVRVYICLCMHLRMLAHVCVVFACVRMRVYLAFVCHACDDEFIRF